MEQEKLNEVIDAVESRVKAGDVKSPAIRKKASSKPNWTKDDEIKLISQDKIDILDHKAQSTVWIGAKDAGKSRPVIVRKRTLMETNKDAYCLDLKKYKLGGISRLHTALNNINLEVKALGFAVVDYEPGINKTYKMDNKTQKTKNQSVEYASFDDANGLAGIEAPNNGFFAEIHVEEPVMIDDPGKTPTRSEWNAALKTIKDSVNRSNRKYSMVSKKPVVSPKYHFTMNAWDKEHPLIEEANAIFPESEFEEFFLQDLFKNHTDTRYDDKTNTLYVRLTKFANPVIRLIEELLYQNDIKTLEEWRNVPKAAFEAITASNPQFAEMNISYELIEMHLEDGASIHSQCLAAISTGDSLELARLLGLTYEGETSDKKVYNLNNLKTGNVEEIIKNLDNKTKLVSHTISYDVDTRQGRGFVMTPVWKFVRNDLFGNKSKLILIGKQETIATYGDNLRLVPIYVEQLKKQIEKQWDKSQILNKNNNVNRFLYMDENRANYLYQVRDCGYAPLKAQKHGQWDILHRQDYVQSAIDAGWLIIDESNTKLIEDLKKSVAKEGSRQRDESGVREKDYDRINSLEYGLYPYRMEIFNDIPAIEIENML